MALTRARRWLPRVTKDRTISRGETVSRSFRQPPCRRSLYIVTHGGGRQRDAIRHQVDHTETTEPISVMEHREQHNLRGEWLNKTTVYNKHIIVRALDLRPKNVPLITVSNHHSCFDDPGIWATLDVRHGFNRRKIRWSLAAQDICFTNVWHSYFFMLGKCIPIVRGAGVYQEAMDFCIERLACGEWVHVFPEGKVNMLKEEMRLKWGVGRLILESPITPIVIPICHLGMDEVLPNEPPYMFKMGKKVTMNYGEPIDFSELLADLRASKTSEMEARKVITDRIQEELSRLKAVTEKLHAML
ncbi:tafazzin isoform X1 [Anoplolepis gracilipes]|uniref:tafazzin isoform X1 n=1 Tax=Anoplolepis gracilipes TaxID=354296 RepID=UPI003B9E84F1